MSRVDMADDDETTNAAKSGGVSLKRADMLKLLDSWGATETIIRDVSKALVMPKIIPLRAFFKTAQENAFDIVDCSWDHVRAQYLRKFQVTLAEEAPTDFRSVFTRDWVSRCWHLSQGQFEASADDHAEALLKGGRGGQDADDADLEVLNKESFEPISADEARILKGRADELRALEAQVKKGRELLSQRRCAEEKLRRDSKAADEFAASRAKLNREILQINGELGAKRADPSRDDRFIQRRNLDDHSLNRGDLAGRNDRYDKDSKSKRGPDDEDDQQSSRRDPLHDDRDESDSGRARKRGNLYEPPPIENLEGVEGNQLVMVGLIKGLATPEIMSMFGLFRLSEAFKIRCSPELGAGSTGNELVEAMRRESGSGMLQTAAGEIARLLTGPVPAKLLDLLRLNPRVNWPLALFTTQNLYKIGTNEGLMVKIQQANGVVSTKSSVGKLTENWETVNDLLEPLRRYTAILSVFDPVYGHVLNGLLGVVTREMIYSKSVDKFKPSEINRLRLYVELVRDRFGGASMSASDIPKFFHYDTAIGVEAQYALDDLVRANAKEEAAAGSKAKRGEEDDTKDPEGKAPRKHCWDFNSDKGCLNTKCNRIHKCKICESSTHIMKDCPKRKKA